MATKPAQRAAADRWDAEHMAYQTVKVKKKLLDDFKAACASRGDKVNTVLREAMENYVDGSTGEQATEKTQTVRSGPLAASGVSDDTLQG